MNVKKIYYFIMMALSGVVAASAQVQQPHSLYFMQTIPQISQMNPALQPRANGYVNLPVNLNMAIQTEFAAKDLFQKQNGEWATFLEEQFDYEKLWKSIGKKTMMTNVGADIDILGFGFRAGKSYLSFGLSEHVSVNSALPTELFKITESGFPDESTLNLSFLRAQSMAYMQLRIGYSVKLGDRLFIGVNVKPLSGQMAAVSKIQNIKLLTSQQQWDIEVKGDVFTSAPVDWTLNEEEKISKTEMRDINAKEWRDYTIGFHNPGIAFDFGAAFQVSQRFALSAALNNIGAIFWKKDLTGMTANGSFQFRGIDLDISEENKKDMWNGLIDSLKNVVQYQVQHKEFQTALTPVIHLGASYNLTRGISLGLLSRSVFWENDIRQSFNLSLNLQPYSFVAFNAGATWQVNGSLNLGGGFMFLMGPLQFYLLADNIPVYYSTLRINTNKETGSKVPVPEYRTAITLRTGLNLVFGRHGSLNKPMLNKGKSSWN